ncbi:SGNH-hydrolase-like protein [Sarcoptes scabiei]|uniref:SGNH-hydrolase-like protein n=1 Tax=Sarcoptes scabiei TaxID=52283 RepID=A0A132AKU8_SARSC|nr:SGNH-hydrolase-like protein [Sarcoptes scabiei]
MNTLMKNRLPAPPYPHPTGCPQAPDNWPRLMAEQSGTSVSDYSCTAQTSAQAAVKLEQAIAEHAIGPATETVVVAVGFNDFGPYGLADGVNITDFGAVETHYVDVMHRLVDRVRAVAPAARVVIAGTPAIGSAGAVCVVNVIPGHPGGLPIPVENWEQANQHMQSRAAAETGAQFLDLREASAGHDTCTPVDSERFISGVVDTTSPAWHMWIHPTAAGTRFIADQVGKAV